MVPELSSIPAITRQSIPAITRQSIPALPRPKTPPPPSRDRIPSPHNGRHKPAASNPGPDPESLRQALDESMAIITTQATPAPSPSRKRQRIYGDRYVLEAVGGVRGGYFGRE